jgi:dTDP-glucose 4,6-dehydratase
MNSILVTGGAGFIGSNFIRMVLTRYPEVKVVNLDALTYAGNIQNLADIAQNPNYIFVKGDIGNGQLVEEIIETHEIKAIINFAAESHVDRSIDAPGLFIDTNIRGTMTLLKASLDKKIEKFVQISTDEVYGSLGPEGAFTEDSHLCPNSPYSASKTSADLITQAFGHTWGLKYNITRCSNNYGPYQFPEKMIPLMINNAVNEKPLPVYGNGLNVRDWIHVDDHCRALWLVLTKAEPGQIFNIGANNEKTNLEVVKKILKQLGKSENLITFVTDRPGHDKRYAIDNTKITAKLGWKPTINFDQGLADTIQWYKENNQWLKNVVSGDYKNYYKKMYVNR